MLPTTRAALLLKNGLRRSCAKFKDVQRIYDGVGFGFGSAKLAAATSLEHNSYQKLSCASATAIALLPLLVDFAKLCRRHEPEIW